MKNFKNIKFKWTFRKYQQRVLDNSSKFLKDGKINIVAAPGSGKTILGLEMIVRLNSPCIIFSPTTTIREQWGERFKEAFLDESLDVNDYVSNDLNNIKLKTRLVDCVGYFVDGALGLEEDGKTRKVKTPWNKEEIPFEKAAEIEGIYVPSFYDVTYNEDGTIQTIEGLDE